MVLQQDKSGIPPPFGTGLPPGQPSEDVPRWLVVLGALAACILLVALLRYAVDLLGVVFLIILVGFSIRAVSDWLTEGESVSGWSMAAVLCGVFGTVMVGLWLFTSRDASTGALENNLPSPILAAVDWLEARGWGQRVLLGGGPGGFIIEPPSKSTPSALPSGEAARRSTLPTTGRAPASEPSGGEPREPAAASRGEPEASPSTSSIVPSAPGAEASRSTASSATAPDRSASGAGRPASIAAVPTAAPPEVEPASANVSTATSMTSSEASAVVGTAVRFTASVTGDGRVAPAGVVVFFDGDRQIGAAPVRGTAAGATASMATLDLSIGDHTITAEFRGARGFTNSRSRPVTQIVTRR